MAFPDALDRFAMLEPVSWSNVAVFGVLAGLNLNAIVQGNATGWTWLLAIAGIAVFTTALALSVELARRRVRRRRLR